MEVSARLRLNNAQHCLEEGRSDHQHPNGNIELGFSDWTPVMMCLASRLWHLPLLPGCTVRTHEIGMDELARMKFGYVMVDLLFDHASDLDYCPNRGEVVTCGQALFKMCTEVELVRRKCSPRFGDIITNPDGQSMMWDGSMWLAEHKPRHPTRKRKSTLPQPARSNKFTRGCPSQSGS